MGIKDNYYIQEINHETATNIVVKCHYAHRQAPCTHAFGLYSRPLGRIVGVCIYGSPVGRGLCEGICGKEEVDNVYELTRLYVDDGLERNLESFLVSHTLKLLDKEIIVSYADTKMNHIGVIYQATNFYYTGLSSGHKDYSMTVEGHTYHNKTCFEILGGIEGLQKGIESVIVQVTERSRKHRYVYFNCDKRRKQELLKKLNYPILPYPKQEGSVPITSTENIQDNTKKRLF